MRQHWSFILVELETHSKMLTEFRVFTSVVAIMNETSTGVTKRISRERMRRRNDGSGELEHMTTVLRAPTYVILFAGFQPNLVFAAFQPFFCLHASSQCSDQQFSNAGSICGFTNAVQPSGGSQNWYEFGLPHGSGIRIPFVAIELHRK